jgi:hypothetical protein
LAEIVGYERQLRVDPTNMEQKHPDQIFLGIEPGALISLADKKAFRPTNQVHRDFYSASEPLSDHIH